MSFLKKLFSDHSQGKNEYKVEKRYPFLASNISGFKDLDPVLQELNQKGSAKKWLNIMEETLRTPGGTVDQKKKEQLEMFYTIDDLSYFKIIANEEYTTRSHKFFNWDDKFASPSIKFLTNNSLIVSYIYPRWFWYAYPDVVIWAVKGDGKIILEKNMGYKLSYLKNIDQSDAFQDFMTTEFYGNFNNENSSIKIRKEHLREIIELYKNNNPNLALECTAE